MIDAYKFSLNLKEREGEERFCFIAEWYDPHAAFIRRYQFMYYVKDGTVEMVSTCIKTQSVVDLSFQYYQCSSWSCTIIIIN